MEEISFENYIYDLHYDNRFELLNLLNDEE